MFRTILLIGILWPTAHAVCSSITPDINGVVSDQNGAPIPYANILLLSSKDSTFIQGVMADSIGHFQLSTSNAATILKASALGYESTYTAVNTNSSIQIQMNEQAAILGDIEVKSQMPKTQLKGTSMITSIEGTVLSNAGTLNDILGKVPGIMQNSNRFEVVGKGVPVFYINGRKVQDTKEFKHINSNDIDEIEVIQNPGAKYGAEAMAVVRIKTKKRQGDGLGFDLVNELQQNIRRAHTTDSPELHIHYQRNGLEMFGEVSYWQNAYDSHQDREQTTHIMNDGSINTIVQDGYRGFDWKGEGFYYNLGTNYELAPKHSIGFRMENLYTWYDKTIADMSVDVFNNSSFSDHITSVSNDYKKDPYYMEGNMFYNGKIGELGIDLNVDYFENHTSVKSIINEHSKMGDETITTDNDTKNRMWATKLVLQHPLWGGQVEFGSENSFVNRKISYTAENAGLPQSSSTVSEVNASAFFTYTRSFDKIGEFTAGLRFEHIYFDYHDIIGNENDIERKSDSFYPSASWSTHFGPVQSSLSYTRKTVRPEFWMLNDAINYQNCYTYRQGNPMLKDEHVQVLEFNTEWSWLSLNASYKWSVNPTITWGYLYNNTGTILLKSINLDIPVNYYTIYASMSPTIGCWTPYWTVGFQKFDLKQTVEDPREADGKRQIWYHKPHVFGSLNNIFSLSNGWQFELNLDVKRRGDIQTSRLTRDMYGFSAVAQKSWLKDDALCLRVSIDDILRKTNQAAVNDMGYYKIWECTHSDDHRICVTLSYSFNATDRSYKGNGAGNETKGRMSREKE